MDVIIREFKKITDLILSNDICIELFDKSNIAHIRFLYKNQLFLISLHNKYILTIDNVYYLADCDHEDVISFLKNVFSGKKPSKSLDAILLASLCGSIN